jgi:ABC-type transport system involved in multi-copper enzyme maturation permease subunit
MTLLEMLVLTSVCILFSEIASNLTTSIAFTFFMFIIGHISYNLKLVAINTENLFLKIIVYVCYYAIPNLEYFNLKDKLYNITSPITFAFIIKVSIYSFVYSLFVLFISNKVFNRKEFK